MSDEQWSPYDEFGWQISYVIPGGPMNFSIEDYHHHLTLTHKCVRELREELANIKSRSCATCKRWEECFIQDTNMLMEDDGPLDDFSCSLWEAHDDRS